MPWVTQATDDFNRTDENPLAGNWTTIFGQATLVLTVTHVEANVLSQNCGAYWNGRVWADNQSSSARLTCTGTGGANQGVGLGVRTTSGVDTGYRFFIDHAASNNAALRRRIAGVSASLVQWTQAFTDGDRFTFRVSGPASAAFLEVLQNGVVVQTFTDNSSIASGSPAMAYSSTETVVTFDDWEGGELAGGGLGDDPPIGFLGLGA